MQLNTDKMLAEKSDGIGWMTFNNPARRNATSLEMWEAIDVILKDFESDDKVRVIVMKGAGGKAFVAGADISEFKEKRNDAEAAERYAQASDGAKALMANLKKPLIAMINGFCLGGGLAVAMSADMRFAADDAQLGAAEAQQAGLVNRVVPVDKLEETVTEIAKTISRNAPLSVNASKVTIKEVLKDESQRDLAKLAKISEDCFNSADYQEGRQAFMEKREPVFIGR